MATKTIKLNGVEQRADELGGYHTSITNNSGHPIYASAKPGVVPYADGVFEIAAGNRGKVLDTNGTVYLLGDEGRAELTSTISENFNMPSSLAGGGGGITRAEVSGIVTEKIAEVVADAPEDLDTLKEISDWIEDHEDSAAAMNSIIKTNADNISNIQTEQETQNTNISALRDTMKQKADISSLIGMNLLDNPDFSINQRGQSEYTPIGNKTYTFDRWFIGSDIVRVTKNNGYITIERSPNEWKNSHFSQIFETPVFERVTVSISCRGTGSFRLANNDNFAVIELNSSKEFNIYHWTVDMTAESVDGISLKLTETCKSLDIKWIKAEIGDQPTQFIPPHPAMEQLKCQRYYQRLKGMSSRFFNGSGLGYTNTQLDVVIPLPVF